PRLDRPQPVSPPKRPKTAGQGPKRRDREGVLRYTGQWLAAAAATPGGRWGLTACAPAVLVVGGRLLYSLIPTQLESRGQQPARAWRARDPEQIKKCGDPTQAEGVPRRLKQSPPRDLANQAGAPPGVRVSVQRNDGRTAALVIQVKAKKKDGTPGH